MTMLGAGRLLDCCWSVVRGGAAANAAPLAKVGLVSTVTRLRGFRQEKRNGGWE